MFVIEGDDVVAGRYREPWSDTGACVWRMLTESLMAGEE